MAADPPASLLITPDQRRRLQQRYEEAQRLAVQPRPDYRRIHDLLAGCVAADPGSILYLEALLANLRRRDAAGGRSWWRRLRRMFSCRFFRSRSAANRGGSLRPGAADSASGEPNDACLALVGAPPLLWNAGWANDSGYPAFLRELAAAAERCEFDEVELRYLAAARALVPDDTVALRALAVALTRQGLFEDAVGPWFAVLALEPGDAEAAQAIDDLRGAGELSSAETQLAQEQSAAGGDLLLLERREELRLRHSEARVAIAARRAEHDSHPRSQSLVGRLAAEHERLAMEILNLRVERLPQSAELRLELAWRLKRLGNYSGAVQRLDEALPLVRYRRPNAGSAEDQELTTAILTELGECWQHLRQFAKALDYYEQAVAVLAVTAAEATRGEPWKLARYRSGVLAAALGQIDLARQRLGELASTDAAFKDAAERLDKLPQN